MNWLHFIGKTYYPDEEEFKAEAARYGVSRRIDKRIMDHFNFGDRVFLFQKVRGKDYSKMFGHFTVDRVLGSSMGDVMRALKEQGKVTSQYEEKDVFRRCGLYKIKADHDVEVSIPEITEKMMVSGAEDAMAGGEFVPTEGIFSEISFQQGFRPFNHEEFEQDRQKAVAEGKKDGSTKRKRVDGYYYDDVVGPEDPPKKGKIIEIENYVQKPTTQELIEVFEKNKIQLVNGQIEVNTIPEDKMEVTIKKGEKSYLVDVFYGTDRKEIGGKDFNKFYGTERSKKLQYGICTVHIPPEIHQIGKIPRPKGWLLQFQENKDRHFVIINISPQSPGIFKSLLSNKVQGSGDKDAFVFVHGYNVNFAAAAMRTAQIAFDIGFKGAPMMYSWPSQGKLFGYFGDQDNVRHSIPNLVEFLENAIQWSGAEKMHVIAHSMGNVCLTEAVLEVTKTFKAKVAFNNIILAAPDIDRDTFLEQIAPKLIECPETLKRITLYASSKDLALNISRVIRRNRVPRAGEGGKKKIVVVEGIDSIDASAVGTDILGHGYIANTSTLIEDLTVIMQKDYPPSHEERNLKERVKNKIKYWLFSRTRKKRKPKTISPLSAKA